MLREALNHEITESFTLNSKLPSGEVRGGGYKSAS